MMHVFKVWIPAFAKVFTNMLAHDPWSPYKPMPELRFALLINTESNIQITKFTFIFN